MMMPAVPVRGHARCLNLVCVIMTKYNKNCQQYLLMVFIFCALLCSFTDIVLMHKVADGAWMEDLGWSR